jgi:Na+/glutamate symporter
MTRITLVFSIITSMQVPKFVIMLFVSIICHKITHSDILFNVMYVIDAVALNKYKKILQCNAESVGFYGVYF